MKMKFNGRAWIATKTIDVIEYIGIGPTIITACGDLERSVEKNKNTGK